MFFKRRGKKIKGRSCDPQAALWAGITLITFPIITTCANILGWNPVIGFLLGALGSGSIILIEYFTRKTIWMHDKCFKEWLDHPDTVFRLIAFIAAIMLTFQTILVSAFIFNTSFDSNITKFVLKRQCEVPTDTFFLRVCDLLERDYQRSLSNADLISKAIRDYAEKRYFPESSFVSCAERPISQLREGEYVYRGSLVSCDRWIAGSLMKTAVSAETVYKFVLSESTVNEDGSYRIVEWNDEPASDEWRSIHETFSTKALDEYHDIEYIEGIKKRLDLQSKYRIEQDLKRD